MDIGIYRLTVFLTGLGLMLAIETFFPCRKWDAGRKGRLIFHGSLMAFNLVVLRFPAVIPMLLWLEYINLHHWGIASLLSVGGLKNILIGIVVLDMFNYWWHRFNHRIPLLWRFHKVHHVDTHVDVTTSLRFHPGELALSSLAKAFWIIIWGPTIWAFAIFESTVSLAAQFHHCNIDFPDRVETLLRMVFVTPRFHTSHHTVSRRTGDANFSTIFIFWDKLFGTYRQPDYTEMGYLGLEKGRESYLSIGPTLKGPFTRQY